MKRRDWELLIHRHLDGTATREEVEELSSQLERDGETRLVYLRLAQIHSALVADEFDEPVAQQSEPKLLALRERLKKHDQKVQLYRYLTFAMATATVILMIAGYYTARSYVEPEIASVRSIDGDVRWTGNGGEIENEMVSGQTLTGGTLETLSVDSMATFAFDDGTSITVFGLSVLTISEHDRKELLLRKGSLSATVRPQPEGEPLRLATPVATMDVLGTRFDVSASESQIKIAVREGTVRVTRVTDQNSTDVHAEHTLVTRIDSPEPMVAQRLSKPIYEWTASPSRDKGEGEWIPAIIALREELSRAVEAGELTRAEAAEIYGQKMTELQRDDGVLKATPRRAGSDGSAVTYVASLDISQTQSGPIVLTNQSRLRIRGQLKKPGSVLFGLSAANEQRTVSGRFVARRRVDSKFDIEIAVTELTPLGERSQTTSYPNDMEALNWFCIATEPGLMIEHVELLSK